MTAATIIAEAFGEDAVSDLYGAVLAVPSDATPSQLRKAYHKAALRYHPDKVRGGGDDAEVTKLKFQAVSVAYQILSDEDRRTEYDETGELVDDDEEGGFGSGRDGVSQWTEYFASIFGKVTFDDIDNFSAKYKRSDEEEADVLKYYKSCMGNLNKMVDCVMCSDASDKKRWVRDILEPAIARGDVPRYDALERTLGQEEEEDEDDEDEGEDSDYDDDDDNIEHSDEDTVTEDDEEVKEEKPKKGKNGGARTKKKTSSKSKPAKKGGSTKVPAPQQKKGRKKMSKKEREAKEAEELIAKIRGKQGGSSGTNSLAMRREEAFNGLISNLESRYSNGGDGGKKSKKKKRSKLPPEDIPDDEFERIQASLNANKQKSRKKS